MDEILGIKINIKFWKSKLGLEFKYNAQWIQIKYKTYIVLYRHNINLLFI